MRSIKNSLVTLGFLLVCTIANAQKSTSNIYEMKGDNAYASILYADAVQIYKKAYLISKSNDASINIAAKIADCYWLMRKYDSAYRWYRLLPAERIAFNPKEKIRFAELKANMLQYKEAATELRGISGYDRRVVGFEQSNKMMRDSIHWKVQFLDGINTDFFREFSPMIVDTSLIWTTNQPKSFSQNGIMGWDNMGYNRLMKVQDLKTITPVATPARALFDLNKSDSNRPKKLAVHYELAESYQLSTITIPPSLVQKLKKIQTIANPVDFASKLNYNVAHATYASTAKTVFISVNQQGKLKNKTRNLSLAYANLNGLHLGLPKFILEQQADYSNMHPAVNAEGTVIVFSSNRVNGKGGFDLYYTQRNADSSWSEPLAVMGVNTVGNELFPSFGANGKFYFSSDAYPGLGGLDIYTASFENGVVKQIRHVSYPVNSSYDDFGLTVMPDGLKGYFSSDRLGTDDIYQYEQEKKPILITGSVRGASSQQKKSGVEVSIVEKEAPTPGVNSAAITKVYTNLTEQEKLDIKKEMTEGLGEVEIDQLTSGFNIVADNNKQTTGVSGTFSFWAKPNRSYEVIIRDGQNDETKIAVNTNGITGRIDLSPVDMIEVKLEPVVEVSKPVDESAPSTLSTSREFIVYFAFDKDVIRQQYADTLDQVVTILKANPNMIVELAGHTDQYGDDPYNNILSDKRVVNVKKYMERGGIEDKRISISSYGEKKLIKLVKSIKKAEINRRVEIRLINKY